jgi:hypothetical protein
VAPDCAAARFGAALGGPCVGVGGASAEARKLSAVRKHSAKAYWRTVAAPKRGVQRFILVTRYDTRVSQEDRVRHPLLKSIREYDDVNNSSY